MQESLLKIRQEGNQEKPSAAQETLRKAFIFAFFVSVDVGKVLAFSWAIRGTPIQSQSIVIINSLASIVIGTAVSFKVSQQAGLRDCFDITKIVRFFQVAVLFSLQQTLGALQYVALSPATAKVLAQVRLPILALGSKWVVGKTYSLQQWVGLMMITITAVAFCEVQAGNAPAKGEFFGYFCSIAASLLSVIAGLFSERFLKDAGKTPFYTQKVQLELGGIVTGVFMMFFMPWFGNAVNLDTKEQLNVFNQRTEVMCHGTEKTVWGANAAIPEGCEIVQTFQGNFLDGWQISTVVCLTMLMLQSWMAGYMAKAMSQLMKQVGQCASLLLCYFLGDCLIFKRGKITPELTGIAFAVTASMAFFLSRPNMKKSIESQVPDSPADSVCSSPGGKVKRLSGSTV